MILDGGTELHPDICAVLQWYKKIVFFGFKFSKVVALQAAMIFAS